jgi:DNA-binding MarR family transcriptional regulator
MATPKPTRSREHLYARRPRSEAGAAAIVDLQTLGERVHEADERALQMLGMRSLDALALQQVVWAADAGQFITPSRLAVMLRVSTAAISKLVDRLVAAGRVERRPNPRDRRGVVIAPLGATIQDLADAYQHIYGPVLDVIDDLTDEEAAIVGRFATRLAQALNRAGSEM